MPRKPASGDQGQRAADAHRLRVAAIHQQLQTQEGTTMPKPKAKPKRKPRTRWGKSNFDQLEAWRQQDRAAAQRRQDRQRRENEWISASAPYRGRDGERGGPAWASDQDAEMLRAEQRATLKPTPPPSAYGCAGCGVNVSTRWRRVSSWPGEHFLCAPCADDLASADYTLGSKWRDRLICRAAGLRPGAGYTDLAMTVRFRVYADVDRDGTGTDEPFQYLGADLAKLRSFARMHWPADLIDERQRAAYMEIKAAADAKPQNASSPGLLRLEPRREAGPRWGTRPW